MEEATRPEEVGRTCLVCSDFTLGNHFGIDACRACAAFFRRSIVEKKKYSCRTGGKCTIDKSIRCLCRKCRLQKCLDAGMNVEGVQGKRDPIIPKHHDPNPLFVGSPSESEIVPTTSASSAFTPVVPVLQRPIQPIQSDQPELIFKTLKNYRQLCSIRKATELALVPSSFSNMITSGPMAGMSFGTAGNMSLFFRAQISPVTEFVSNTYEEFALLDNKERWQFLQPFLVFLWWSDCAFRTYKRVPREQFQEMCLFSETKYLDIHNSEAWVADISETSDFLKADLARLLKKDMSSKKQKVIYCMSDMQLRDEEYAAILGLLLWSTTIENSTTRMDEIVRMVRGKIYEELNLYYRINNEFNFASRFGELLNLLTNIMVEMLRCKEDLEIYNLLDVFKKDDFFYEMSRNI